MRPHRRVLFVFLLALMSVEGTMAEDDAASAQLFDDTSATKQDGPTPPPEPRLPAVRVIRFQVDYPSASRKEVDELASKWEQLTHNSVLASLRFINKHWLLCGETPGAQELRHNSKKNDCGRAQVTGEWVDDTHYRLNVTHIAQRDPIRNAKVDATSTVFGVLQIGLKGGIFQYTNSLKALGKPAQELTFDEGFFCNRGYALVDGDKCTRQHRTPVRVDDQLRTSLPS